MESAVVVNNRRHLFNTECTVTEQTDSGSFTASTVELLPPPPTAAAAAAAARAATVAAPLLTSSGQDALN